MSSVSPMTYGIGTVGGWKPALSHDGRARGRSPDGRPVRPLPPLCVRSWSRPDWRMSSQVLSLMCTLPKGTRASNHKTGVRRFLGATSGQGREGTMGHAEPVH
jgi:hypothetical protein